MKVLLAAIAAAMLIPASASALTSAQAEYSRSTLVAYRCPEIARLSGLPGAYCSYTIKGPLLPWAPPWNTYGWTSGNDYIINDPQVCHCSRRWSETLDIWGLDSRGLEGHNWTNGHWA